MGTWLNDDGLYIKYGPTSHKSTAKAGAFAEASSGETVVEFSIDLTDLADTNAIMNDVVRLPHAALVTKVELVVTEAATSGGSAVLDIGIVDADDRTSNADDDYFVAGAALATIDALGDVVTIIQGGTAHGAGVGAAISADDYGVLVTAGYDTAAFTAGKVKVRIFYIANGVVNP